MPYSAPTRGTLVASISRDLRDPDNKAFSTTEVADFISAGLVEVNRVYPLMEVENVDLVLDGEGNLTRQYEITAQEVSRVEVWRDGAFRLAMPEQVENSDTGWSLWGTTLTFPRRVTLDDTADTVKVYGYFDRDFPDSDDDVLEVDAEAEYAIRAYATLMGYQRLQSDRAQFQQWMALPGNNDISPTQLDSLANTYLSQWRQRRNAMRRIRL